VRYIQIVHALPGRTRLRLPWLKDDHDTATRLADQLARLPGVQELEVRPYTGSLLCQHDDHRLDRARLVAHVCALSGIDQVVALGETPPAPPLRPDAPTANVVARELHGLFRDLNENVLRATEGNMDLPTLITVGFLGAGAAEVAVTGRLPLPPWFNLAWWGYSLFETHERPAVMAKET
jgi:hypothetical protein